jgi:hypothetical protein
MHSPHSCYMPCPSHSSCGHSNYTWRRVQVMKLLMQFSPTSHYFIPFLSECSPQHPVLEYSQSMFLNVKVWHPYRTTGRIIVLYSLIFVSTFGSKPIFFFNSFQISKHLLEFLYNNFV